MTISCRTAALVACSLLVANRSVALTPAQSCERTVAKSLAACVLKVAKVQRACYVAGGACAPTDPAVARHLDALTGRILASCPDAGTVQTAGYGPLFAPQTLVDRSREACLGHVASLSARAFGGPHGAVLGAAAPFEKLCLLDAHTSAAKLIRKGAVLQGRCITKERAGGTCDPTAVDAKLTRLEDRTTTRIARKCTDLFELIGLDAPRFGARAAAQARCLVAEAHGDSGPFALDCGPRAAAPVPARATWTQVVLDEATWGTRCGDGSSYAFWIRLAPAGSPIERVVVGLQGGGACFFGSDCAGVSSGLFRALDNNAPSGGYMNASAAVNPFHDWTKIFLPYCTQDVHAGGGTTNVFPQQNLTVHRFGAVNVRAALRHLRDVLWAEMDQTTSDGYRPDLLQVLFGGESAGGFGVSYNHHYLLDDLRWVRTTGVPDSSLGLDNGEPLGVFGLGVLMTGTEGPVAWGSRPFLPPYCQRPFCALVPMISIASAPRLLGVPEQRLLNVSNQVDNTQVATTFFPNLPAWVNAVRSSYCDVRGTPGVHYFLPAVPSHIHTVLRSNTSMQTLTAGGETLGTFLAGALFDPADTQDRVDEGTLASTIAGVQPFPCALGAP
jgi:hypothetical protein